MKCIGKLKIHIVDGPEILFLCVTAKKIETRGLKQGFL